MMKAPPRTGRHLQMFAISLVVLVAALAVFLFGVKMEDNATGKGIVTTSRTLEVRAPANGRIVLDPADDDGTGSTIIFPARPGDSLADGSVLAAISLDNPKNERRLITVASKSGGARSWRMTELAVQSGQRVSEGDLLARFVEVKPNDPERLAEASVRLDIEEKYFGEVAAGQSVRLYSNMYHHRVHGVALGKIERLEPAGESGPNGNRVFHAWVGNIESKFPLKLGSSVRAEIVVGRKPTYQIILEH